MTDARRVTDPSPPSRPSKPSEGGPRRPSHSAPPPPDRLPTAEETDLTIAATEQTRAETARLRAETAKLEAETARAISEAENAANMAILARFARENTERETAAALAGNEYNRLYLFNGAVSDASVKYAINKLTEWDRLYPKQDIEIIFNSGGGSADDGLCLFNFILGLRKAGHKVTTSTLGICASMAGILLQAGDWRTMGKEAWLMIHEASFRAEGKSGEVEDTVEWIKRLQERILGIFAERSHMTVEELRTKWLRRDWWIDSGEALSLGLVDAIR